MISYVVEYIIYKIYTRNVQKSTGIHGIGNFVIHIFTQSVHLPKLNTVDAEMIVISNISIIIFYFFAFNVQDENPYKKRMTFHKNVRQKRQRR